MKRSVFGILVTLCLCSFAFCADEPPEVKFSLQMKVDPYGGAEVGYQYFMTCEPVEDCFIIDQDKLYFPKVGEVYYVEFCNSWGNCTKLLFTPEY